MADRVRRPLRQPNHDQKPLPSEDLESHHLEVAVAARYQCTIWASLGGRQDQPSCTSLWHVSANNIPCWAARSNDGDCLNHNVELIVNLLLRYLNPFYLITTEPLPPMPAASSEVSASRTQQRFPNDWPGWGHCTQWSLELEYPLALQSEIVLRHWFWAHKACQALTTQPKRAALQVLQSFLRMDSIDPIKSFNH